MIDPADKQTSSLPLEQPRRGRGRPSTGKAMTPAEKQKAYRLRQKEKSNVTEKDGTNDTSSIELLRNRALLRGRTCVAQARMIRDLELRIDQLKEELASRSAVTEKGDLPGVWIVEIKRIGTRTWKPCGNPDTTLIEARKSVDYMQFKSGSGQGDEWRAIRADGLIYWPLWNKAKAAK